MSSARYDYARDVSEIEREHAQQRDREQRHTPRLFAVRERIQDVIQEGRRPYQTAIDLEALLGAVEERISFGKDCTEAGERAFRVRLEKLEGQK